MKQDGSQRNTVLELIVKILLVEPKLKRGEHVGPSERERDADGAEASQVFLLLLESPGSACPSDPQYTNMGMGKGVEDRKYP